jgi:hypothetical protein
LVGFDDYVDFIGALVCRVVVVGTRNALWVVSMAISEIEVKFVIDNHTVLAYLLVGLYIEVQKI